MLKGKKIAAIATDGYHNTELTDPMDALLKEGVEVVVICVKPEQLKEGLLDHLTLKAPEKLPPEKRIKPSLVVNDAKAEDYDGLLIPGGYSPEQLRNFPEAVEFAKDVYANGKPIMAICHGTQLLISADVIKGKNVTAVGSIAVDVKNAGGIYIDKPLVVDGNLVTSRTPRDMDQFIEGCKNALK